MVSKVYAWVYCMSMKNQWDAHAQGKILRHIAAIPDTVMEDGISATSV